jgi:hypothetical protein
VTHILATVHAEKVSRVTAALPAPWDTMVILGANAVTVIWQELLKCSVMLQRGIVGAMIKDSVLAR